MAMKKIMMLCLLSGIAFAAFAQQPKETGFFAGAGAGMNFGIDGLAYESRSASHYGAGLSGDFYAGYWLTGLIGVRAGYQGFRISDRITDFGNRKYNYIHGDLMLQANRSVIPYIHGGFVSIVNSSFGGGAGIMLPIHLGKHVSIVPDLKATGFSSKAFATGQNLFAVALSATMGVAFRFGGKKPEPEPEAIIEPIIQTIHDTVTVHEVMKETVTEVVRDTVYIQPIPEEPLVLNTEATFDVDSDILKTEAYPELDKIVDLFKNHPNARGRIEGHTDNTGSAAYNQNLSERRAMAVYQYLVVHGVSSDRLSHAGYGYSRPVATNDTPEGRQLNRRVEITVEE